MAYDGEADRQPPASSGLATAVQAHLGRASRFVDGKTRNWSLFFFFRIMSQACPPGDIRCDCRPHAPAGGTGIEVVTPHLPGA